ncbi:unnamed protein product [Closterium sp. Yama58-4]|nr:unnamed protein product [Closterium sp. Yama58-4]
MIHRLVGRILAETRFGQRVTGAMQPISAQRQRKPDMPRGRLEQKKKMTQMVMTMTTGGSRRPTVEDPSTKKSLRQHRPVSAVTNSAPRAASVDRDGNPANARSGGQGPVVPPSHGSKTPTQYSEEYVESLRARVRAQEVEILEMRDKQRAHAAEPEPVGRAHGGNKRKNLQRSHDERETRQQEWEQAQANPEAPHVFPFAQFSTFVHEAMQAERCPAVQEKVEEGKMYIVHVCPDDETTFWPDDGLVKRSMAAAMEFTEKEDISRLHLVLELDKQRSAIFTHVMQKYRSDTWLIARANFYILNGMAYTKPASARIALPAVPDPTVVKPKTEAEFTTTFEASKSPATQR